MGSDAEGQRERKRGDSKHDDARQIRWARRAPAETLIDSAVSMTSAGEAWEISLCLCGIFPRSRQSSRRPISAYAADAADASKCLTTPWSI